jgi:hypothetical protein
MAHDECHVQAYGIHVGLTAVQVHCFFPVQARLVQESKGERIAADLVQSESGASLEVGGAHWFASAPGSNLDEDASQDMSGKLSIEVRVG